MVFGVDEDLIFFRGQPLFFRKGRRERQIFKYLFARRGRLILYSELHDAFARDSLEPFNLIRVFIYEIKKSIKKNNLPISIKAIYGEGYIMYVDAQETL